VRYNAFHDQLLLSAGSDSRVLLSNMSSLASDVGEAGAEERDGTEEHDGDLTEGQRRARSVPAERRGRDRLLFSTSPPPVATFHPIPFFFCRKLLKRDCLLASYDEHEDSVYAIEWASDDPWTFASLSYDGRFVVNRVASDVKYSILL
jgi:WD40 repeat protein